MDRDRRGALRVVVAYGIGISKLFLGSLCVAS